MMHLPFLPRPIALHIPDGFLSLPVAITFWLISIVFINMAIRKTRGQFGERQIPLMGIMAAFIFAAQMINFPVAGGTSGHLLGGALAAIVLGPWAGMLVMVTVVSVQALIFQDGGLVVMGANIFNMGLLTTLVGYGLYRGAANRSKKFQLGTAGFAAWMSVMAGALLTAFQLWLSGTSPLRIVFPAMLSVHFLIGLGEAFITVAALTFIFQTRPDILSDVQSQGGRGWILTGALITLAVLLISPFASGNPDGLERVAMNLNFIQRGAEAPFQILPDYTIPALGETGLSTIIAGGAGILVVAGLTMGIIWLIRKPRHIES